MQMNRMEISLPLPIFVSTTTVIPVAVVDMEKMRGMVEVGEDFHGLLMACFPCLDHHRVVELRLLDIRHQLQMETEP